MRGHDHGHQFQAAASNLPQTSFSTGSGGICADPLSTRHVEELMAERGAELDHATINRWVIEYRPLLEEAFQRSQASRVWMSSAPRRDLHQSERPDSKCLYAAVDNSVTDDQLIPSLHTTTSEQAEHLLTKAIPVVIVVSPKQSPSMVARLTRQRLKFFLSVNT